MGFGSLDGGIDDEHDGVSFVIFVAQDIFFLETEPFDRIKYHNNLNVVSIDNRFFLDSNNLYTCMVHSILTTDPV